MSSSTSKRSGARQRLIETAERLFYAEGIRAVGIDRIIAEAEVAKMTLYNHFASKDELILAVLQYREEKFDEMFAESMDRHRSAGMSKIEAFFAALKEWFDSPNFRGCAFINASVELADADHPASRFSTEHKHRLHESLREYIVEASGKAAGKVAPAVSILVEGAIVTALMEQDSSAADVAGEAALALVKQASRKRT